jgi:uncharacterized protein YbbC (DUF1343 family)/CubicO group peptidase (beta-lactamase class C family)
VNQRGRLPLRLLLGLLIFFLAGSDPAHSQSFQADRLAAIPPIVEAEIHAGQIPGAVILVGQGGKILFHQAFGWRTYEPRREPMFPDTLFDIASLTKVVATTPALLQLVEKGKLNLDDRVVKHWPKFKGHGKERITIRQLLTHYSGLRASLPVKPEWSGYETALKKIAGEKPLYPPGSRFLYSDLNFIILGEIIRRVSRQPLDVYCRYHLFQPLGMKDTFFLPLPSLYDRLAATKEGSPGEIHDPIAYRMGGVAGHSGVFSTAGDLALFAQALLDGGSSRFGQVLARRTVEKMVLPHSPPGQIPLRGLGWAIHSPSISEPGSNWSEWLPAGSFGHKGYTGTLIWIDPVSQAYLIVLTNRVYPGWNGNSETVRDQVFALVAEATGRAPLGSLSGRSSLSGTPVSDASARPVVKTGVEVLAARNFASLTGKEVGLITNHTGRDSNGRRTIDLVHNARGVKLGAVFSPEHGLSGQAEGKIPPARDAATGVPVFSLYGETLRPTPQMLAGLDALVFDVQDAGVRFYTYITTMGYAMEAAARQGIPFYVLDRPNPINASVVQGPVMEGDLKSFTGYFPLALRHGMTTGELARMFNEENRIGVKLTVTAMAGYQRSAWFDETGLPWVNPSPNLRSLTQAILYPGVALVEGANVSVGRGTDMPFELLGAPWIKGQDFSDYLNGRQIPGVEFQPAAFIPDGNRHQGRVCYGVRVMLTDRRVLDSAALGIEIISALHRLYPRDFEIEKTLPLIGSRSVLQAIKEGKDPKEVPLLWQDALSHFRHLRSKYLLYPE